MLLGNKTGATRLGFAVLLKMFQVNGRFPHRLEEVPLAAVEAIASQIEVPAEAWRGYDWHSRTAAYHRAQIRDALGFREATLDDTDDLARWLESRVSVLEHRPDRLLVADLQEPGGEVGQRPARQIAAAIEITLPLHVGMIHHPLVVAAAFKAARQAA